MSTITNAYFEWLCGFVANHKTVSRYSKLLAYLFKREFYWQVLYDENRAIDGLNLRCRYSIYTGMPAEGCLPDDKCSVLEMMVGLSVRCEESIMSDPEIGDRTGKWFWGMVDNLDLIDMDDDHYDLEYVDRVITRLLDRKYACNGRGGLFTVHNRYADLRDVEIWYQMNWYLTEAEL